MFKINSTTQDHLDIIDVKNNLVVLQNGSICAVIQTKAVNFNLLSEIEQDAIIAAFSMLLNSITFPVQVVIRSKKLDITKYIEKVIRVERQIADPLLKKQAEAYRKFVQEVIKQNEVLDKSFYVVIPAGGAVTGSELATQPFGWVGKLLGKQNKRISVDVDKTIKNYTNELMPKVDHVIKQFNRIGIQSKQLTTQELVQLYFDIYNPVSKHSQRIKTNVDDYKTAIVNPALIEE